MAAFNCNINASDEPVSVKLDRSFKEDDWKELIEFYKSSVAEGRRMWDLDLTEVEFFGSNSIGMLIALNTSIMANTGNLRVFLPQQSAVTNQIRFARIDQILNCVFT